jgi:hypothetical protein
VAGLNDLRLEYLGKLGLELLTRGVECELITTGIVPRLRLGKPCECLQSVGADLAFEDNIIAAQLRDGKWQFWWPWIQPIGLADDPAGAADHIICNTVNPSSDDAEETIRR